MMFALYYAKCVNKAKEVVKPIIWNSVMLLTFADNNVIIGEEQDVKLVKAAIADQLRVRDYFLA